MRAPVLFTLFEIFLDPTITVPQRESGVAGAESDPSSSVLWYNRVGLCCHPKMRSLGYPYGKAKL